MLCDGQLWLFIKRW